MVAIGVYLLITFLKSFMKFFLMGMGRYHIFNLNLMYLPSRIVIL